MSIRTAIGGLNAAQTDLSTTANNIANASTLLLAFFVVMYSVSSLNSGKYRVMSEALMAAFRGEPQRDMPITLSIREGMPTSDLVTMPETEKAMGPRPIRKTDAQGMDTGMSLSGIAGNVAKALERQVMTDQVTIRQHADWVEVEIRNDLLFPSGSAGMAGEAADIVRKLGASLANLKNPIFVQGHTDNVPISTAQFPSNWELSAARAGAVVRLLGEGGANTALMTVIGYGEQRPLQPNETADGRATNRRVMLAILEPEGTQSGVSFGPPSSGTPRGGVDPPRPQPNGGELLQPSTPRPSP
jgi:chemotaxis protein MotB